VIGFDHGLRTRPYRRNLRSHAENFMKDKLTRWLIPLVDEGLLTSEGDSWRRQRRLPNPHFNASKSNATPR
jgi:cytochrome P450